MEIIRSQLRKVSPP